MSSRKAVAKAWVLVFLACVAGTSVLTGCDEKKDKDKQEGKK